MRLLSLRLAVEGDVRPGGAWPLAWGGVLHGFVERAAMNHAPALLPLMRPEGRQGLARFTVLPPPPEGCDEEDERGDTARLAFGLMLFGELADHAATLTEALARQCAHRLHGHPTRLLAAEVHDAPTRTPTLPVEPASAIRLHRLVLRSPLLLASGSATHAGLRRHGQLPWPPLGSVLESIAARMHALAPSLAQELLGPGHRWRASPAQWHTEPLTPAADPAREVVARYATRAHQLDTPGLLGTLCYLSEAPEVESALLYWGQWLGVGQKTTMGFGSYVWTPLSREKR